MADHSFVYELVRPVDAVSEATRPDVAFADSRLMAEISEFRGRVLYADGRRPHFRSDDGLFTDEDPQDLESLHVTVRHHGALVACLRLTPTLHSRTFIGRLLGAEDLNTVLRNMRLSGNDCVEAGRWIVLPSARGMDLGRTLLLSCWAVGIWLNKRCLFGLAGTRDGQAKMICRTGGQVVPGMEARLVQDLNDDVALVYFDLEKPPQFIAAQLPSVGRLLQLTDLGDRSESAAAGNPKSGGACGAAGAPRTPAVGSL